MFTLRITHVGNDVKLFEGNYDDCMRLAHAIERFPQDYVTVEIYDTDTCEEKYLRNSEFWDDTLQDQVKNWVSIVERELTTKTRGTKMNAYADGQEAFADYKANGYKGLPHAPRSYMYDDILAWWNGFYAAEESDENSNE